MHPKLGLVHKESLTAELTGPIWNSSPCPQMACPFPCSQYEAKAINKGSQSAPDKKHTMEWGINFVSINSSLQGWLVWMDSAVRVSVPTEEICGLRAVVPPPGLWKCSAAPLGIGPEGPLWAVPLSLSSCESRNSVTAPCHSAVQILELFLVLSKGNIGHFTYSVIKSIGSLVRLRIIPAVSLAEIFLFVMTRSSLRWPLTQFIPPASVTSCPVGCRVCLKTCFLLASVWIPRQELYQ